MPEPQVNADTVGRHSATVVTTVLQFVCPKNTRSVTPRINHSLKRYDADNAVITAVCLTELRNIQFGAEF
jgi:hypothetical protein